MSILISKQQNDIKMNEKEFVEFWVGKISGELLMEFPCEFIAGFETEAFSLPGKALVLGSELFGAFELIDIDGAPVFQIPGYIRSKYILYANRLRPSETQIPVEEEDLSEAVKQYEKHLDELVKSIESDYKKHFPTSTHFHDVSNQIFNSLKLNRY